MGLPANLHASHLRDMHLRTMRGLPVDVEHIEAMIEVLDTLLDEARDAEEPSTSIDDLVGVITRLEKARVEALQQHADVEAEKDEEIANIEKERYDAAKEHEEAIANMREDHEQELQRVRDEYEADFQRLHMRMTEANAAKVLVDAKLAELLASEPYAALSALVSTSSLLDSCITPTSKVSTAIVSDYRRARDRAMQILQGRAKPPTTNEEIPTRRARRAKKGTP